MTTEVRADDLHAGDWIKCPTGQGAYCWIATRRPGVGDEMHFIIGRGPGHIHRDIVMGSSEKVTLFARWPELPAGVKQGALA